MHIYKMKEFPVRLKPKNKSKFSRYLYERNLSYLRKEIYELVLMGNEDDYFVIDKFQRSHHIPADAMAKMIQTVTEELEQLGWKCKTSFGDTGLFIYSTDDPPPSYRDYETF